MLIGYPITTKTVNEKIGNKMWGMIESWNYKTWLVVHKLLNSRGQQSIA
jgi:hypothetical protein